ncbi:hypothetical protein Pcinc_036861 [Petrolisthes cinctipes]|uniref:Uncharacterized protein n=1 Tax=Petrolisthes cinctipes TaxID=88211 RepID=A0AAE1EM63_PETCI|nr:hypothetical protein Pcinc_036861 [Petrolisthes cinctipes]
MLRVGMKVRKGRYGEVGQGSRARQEYQVVKMSKKGKVVRVSKKGKVLRVGRKGKVVRVGRKGRKGKVVRVGRKGRKGKVVRRPKPLPTNPQAAPLVVESSSRGSTEYRSQHQQHTRYSTLWMPVWLNRDSSGAVISSHWEADLTDDEVVDLTEAGRRETSSWEESTAFRELSIAQGKFKVCRV